MTGNDRLVNALIAGVLIASAIISNGAQAKDFIIAGDTTASVELPTTTYPNSPYFTIPACYKMVGKPASAVWNVNGNTATTGVLNLSSRGSTVYITTRGIGITPPSGTSSQYIAISYGSGSYCLNSNGSDFIYFVVNPTLSFPTNGVILQSPDISESTNVNVRTYPPAVGLTITGTCTALNGPTFVPASVSGTTNSSGVAIFPITLNNAVIVKPYGSPIPSANCSFTAGGTSTATINFQTQAIDPTLSLSPSKIVNTGASTIQASIAQNWQGIQINASCAGNGSNIALNQTTVGTDPYGNASFVLTASNLVGFGSVPTPSCKFSVNGGTGSATLSFTTGDACTFGLEPQPPQCGNP